ncbi:MAG: 23S rRNA (adenine(1618)-N(6))-methyltransferase RlmF [Bacteroidetes bacterium]|nr:23S rRNA (adenine(1618)-N(6))-methyltransferase RlmF [Bacteroidota bacterium]
MNSSLKSTLHPANPHRDRYDFPALIKSSPILAEFVSKNKYGDESIDFFNPRAVIALNKALLKKFYHIDFWEIPEGYLCPPIPGRAEYIHQVAILLNANDPFHKNSTENEKVKCLDIGVGANCIYPIIGIQAYNWTFVGSDVDQEALIAAQKIIDNNTVLQGKVELRYQSKRKFILHGIIQKDEKFDLTICNPPFHSSSAEAKKEAIKKLSNLKKHQIKQPLLNFGGQPSEIWCDGGEEKFILKMIDESMSFKTSCRWFTTMVSKAAHLKNIYAALDKIPDVTHQTIQMETGNKVSRIVAWTYQN